MVDDVISLAIPSPYNMKKDATNFTLITLSLDPTILDYNHFYILLPCSHILYFYVHFNVMFET